MRDVVCMLGHQKGVELHHDVILVGNLGKGHNIVSSPRHVWGVKSG